MEKKASLGRRNAIHGFEIPSSSSSRAASLPTLKLTQDAFYRSQYRPVFPSELYSENKQSQESPVFQEEPKELSTRRSTHHLHSPSETSAYTAAGAVVAASQESPEHLAHRSPLPTRLRRRSGSFHDETHIRDLALRRARAYTELIGGTPYDSGHSQPPSPSETGLEEPLKPEAQTSLFGPFGPAASKGIKVPRTRPRFRRAETESAPTTRPSERPKKPPTPRGLLPPEPFLELTERPSSNSKHSVKLREDYTPSHFRIEQPKFFRAPPTESQTKLKDSLEDVYRQRFTGYSRRPSFPEPSPARDLGLSSSSPFQDSHDQELSSPCPAGRPRRFTCSASNRFPGSENLRPGPSRAPEHPFVPKLGGHLKDKLESQPHPRSGKKKKKSKKGQSGNAAPSPVLTQFPQPYTFDTSNKRRFDPLNFVPVTSENSENPEYRPESTQLVPETKRRDNSAEKNPTFDDILNSVPHHSSFDSQLSYRGEGRKSPELDPEEPETRKEKKKKGSLRLVGGLKKLFSPNPRLTAEELKARISFPIGPEPEITTVFYNPILSPTHTGDQEPEPNPSDRIKPGGPITGVQPRKSRIPLPEFEFPSRDMEPSRFLDPSSAVVALTRQKAEAMRLAREQSAAVNEMCRRAKTETPPYEFEELIGKGAYGRVYKGRSLPSHQLVAIKVLDIDAVDYKSIRDLKDESIKDFIHETKVMKQVKDSGAKNINMLIEAISIHSQLWLICEYCPGGSVKTLMRATGNKLEERFIIPIARELAIGLRAIHDAGIIHRDVKAANVLIHEEGRLQICDFGVAGVLQSKVDKRSTWIGTPHWMPPEMFPNKSEVTQYGSEIDVWAYGCTLFEFATGNPPNATLRERMQIGRQLNRFPPKLEGQEYSDELRSLVSFSLDTDPRTRPSMQHVLDHPYIADSLSAYPTASLGDLVRIYYQWAQRGGQRISLFNPGGAAAAEVPGEDSLQREDWNFSTTAGFEKRFSIIDLDQLSASLADLEGELTPIQSRQPEVDAFEAALDADMTPEQQANFNERVKRGGEALDGLFNNEKPGYKYETKNDFVPVEQQNQRVVTDLPLRTDTDRSSVASTFIDINLGAFDSSHYAAGSSTNHPFQLADADTIRANRSSSRLFRRPSGEQPSSHSSDGGSVSSQEAEYQPPSGPRPPTMDWTFPSSMQPAAGEESEVDVDEGREGGEDEFGGDKRDTREWTFPVMTADDGPGNNNYEQEEDEMIDPTTALPPLRNPAFDHHGGVHGYNLDGQADSRPSTSASQTSDPDHDPFRFDRAVVTPEMENISTIRPDTFPDFHTASTSTTAVDTTAPSALPEYQMNHEEQQIGGTASRHGSLIAEPFGMNKSPTKSLSNTNSIRRQRVAGAVFQFPEVLPPSTESLSEGASDEAVTEEMKRLLGDFINGLATVGDALTVVDPSKVGAEKVGESADPKQRDGE
ncbi:hypothetical protein FQN54_005037 [Arachnomyces sp. PD_36]|nr:hypothetical protein FQN54_005037 [Arachnomyces sp. PD_36]